MGLRCTEPARGGGKVLWKVSSARLARLVWPVVAVSLELEYRVQRDTSPTIECSAGRMYWGAGSAGVPCPHSDS